MLNNNEREMLDGLERRLRSEDPRFAARLDQGQQRLPTHPKRSSPRFRPMLVGALAVLAVGLFALGAPGAAVLLAVMAAAIGWLGTVYITSGGDDR